MRIIGSKDNMMKDFHCVAINTKQDLYNVVRSILEQTSSIQDETVSSKHQNTRSTSKLRPFSLAAECLL